MTTQTVTLIFSGRLNPESFAEFARHRARRLSVGLALLAGDAACARMRVTGPRDLVDAFEMALSLGPADCVVTDMRRDEFSGPGPAGSDRPGTRSAHQQEDQAT